MARLRVLEVEAWTSYRPLGETRHPSHNKQLPGLRVAERADCQR
jgi:hypothetical protein